MSHLLRGGRQRSMNVCSHVVALIRLLVLVLTTAGRLANLTQTRRTEARQQVSVCSPCCPSHHAKKVEVGCCAYEHTTRPIAHHARNSLTDTFHRGFILSSFFSDAIPLQTRTAGRLASTAPGSPATRKKASQAEHQTEHGRGEQHVPPWKKTQKGRHTERSQCESRRE